VNNLLNFSSWCRARSEVECWLRQVGESQWDSSPRGESPRASESTLASRPTEPHSSAVIANCDFFVGEGSLVRATHARRNLGPVPNSDLTLQKFQFIIRSIQTPAPQQQGTKVAINASKKSKSHIRDWNCRFDTYV